VMRDAGPEIANGLGAFPYVATLEPGFGRACCFANALLGPWAAPVGQQGQRLARNLHSWRSARRVVG